MSSSGCVQRLTGRLFQFHPYFVANRIRSSLLIVNFDNHIKHSLRPPAILRNPHVPHHTMKVSIEYLLNSWSLAGYREVRASVLEIVTHEDGNIPNIYRPTLLYGAGRASFELACK